MIFARWRLWAWLVALAALVSVTSDARAAGPTFALQGSFTGSSNAFFGYSVAVDGNTAVVGAANDSNNPNSVNQGAAYVYVLSGSTWTLQQQLIAPDGVTGDEFGYEVAISGNTVIVGADEKSPNEQDGGARGQGYVYIFTRSGSTWTLQTEFTSPSGAPGDCFGCSIALTGNTALIGANGMLGGTGGAFVFTGSGSSWSKQAQFGGTASYGYFGSAVALSSNGLTAVIGAPGLSGATGQAYVYTLSGSTWSQQATALASGNANDGFGTAVAVDGSTALVGASTANSNQGAVYVFTTGGSGTPQATLQAPGTIGFGWAVALSGTTALVGAYELASGPGAAYLFTGSGAAWSQEQALTAPVANQDYGYAVALSSGGTAVVGAFGQSNAGGAYIYVSGGAVTPPAAPALGPMGSLCLALLLAGAALWSMNRRGGRGAVVLGLLVGTNACSGGAGGASTGSGDLPSTHQTPSNSGGATGSADTGSVGLQLTLPGGENVNVIRWAITGPNGTTNVVQSSSVTVQALAVRFVVGNIPAGSGYNVTLSGTSTDDTVSCTGAAQFSVAAHATTLVSVQLACSVMGTAGTGTNVNGTTFNCAAWSSVTANPIETSVGSSVALAATASGPSSSGLTYAWSSPTGSFSTPNAAMSSFTCTQVGPAVVTLTVGDGPVPDGSVCNPALDTTTITVTCDPAAADAGTRDGGGNDAGAGDGGSPPPLAAAPAMPPWGLLMLAASILGVGTAFVRRSSRSPEIGR